MEYIDKLEEIIERYFNESHDVYKYNDSRGEPLNISFHFKSRSDYLNKYLDFYKGLNNLERVIDFACTARFKLEENGKIYEIIHPHQQYFIDRDNKPRGIETLIMKNVRDKVLTRISDIQESTTFEEIMNVVNSQRVSGFGDLAIYDSSIRIAAYLGVTPDSVYLHAGALEGAKHLEEKGLVPSGSICEKSIPMKDMPDPLQELYPIQVENLLCSFKSELERM